MNDCIEGVTVYDKDDKNLGSLTFIQDPNFDPFETKQSWTKGLATGTKEEIEGYAFFEMNGFPGGNWKLPAGVKLSDGTDLIGVSAARMLNAVQVNVSPIGIEKGVSLPVGYFFETTLKSKNLKKYTRWITSNGKDPSVIVGANDTVVFKGVASRFPVPSVTQGCNGLFGGNEEKAGSDAAFIAVNASTNLTSESEKPAAEVVMGTNGWWCMGGIAWDAKERQLVFDVAAPHYYPDGTVVDGWLEVKIKGRLAREWWGISPEEATGYAKVEVTYTDGTTKTATVSAKYVTDKDWIDLRAYGFTYSNPAIKVSMKKPESTATPAASVSPTPSPSSTSKATEATTQNTSSKTSQKKSITCVKGKTIKKVTTKTCPAGFKKR